MSAISRAALPGESLPCAAFSVDSSGLPKRARIESAENAALVAQGKAAPRMECPFAALGKYLENADFKWLLNLHAAEGEKDAFEQDVARVKAEAEAEQSALGEDEEEEEEECSGSGEGGLLDSWLRMLKVVGVVVPACAAAVVLPSMAAAGPEALLAAAGAMNATH